MPALVVFTALPSKKEARKIAGVLLQKKLAACVSLLPAVESHFRWKGKRERARECLLLIKTQISCYAKLEKTLCRLHPYDVPEIIAVRVDKGHKPYLDWLTRQTPAP